MTNRRCRLLQISPIAFLSGFLAISPIVAADPAAQPAAPVADCFGKQLTGQIITFDAHTNEYAPKDLKDLQATTVYLVIEHPNTFAYRYSVGAAIIDTHNQAIPNALAGLVISKAPTDTTIKFTSIVSPSTEAECDKVSKAYDRFGSALDAETTDYLLLAQAGADNTTVRSAVVMKIHEALRSSAPGNNLSKQMLDIETLAGSDLNCHGNGVRVDNLADYASRREAVADVAALIPGTMERSKAAVVAAKRAWDEWCANHPDGGDCDANVRKRQAWYEQSLATVGDAAKREADLQVLYLNMLNPSLVPMKIVKQVSLGKADSVTLTVGIEQLGRDAKTTSATLVSAGGGASSTIGATDSYPLELRVYGRWVLDVSAGVSATSLRIKNYFMTTTLDATGKVVPVAVREGPGEHRNFGAAVFVSFYRTTKLPLRASFGPSLGIQASDPLRYLLGASAVIQPANKFRLAFTGGLAYGKVTELNGDVLNGDEQTPAVRPLGGSPSTASIYRRGWFTALTATYGF